MSMCLQSEDVMGTNKLKVKATLRPTYAGRESGRKYSSKLFIEFALEIIATREIDPRTGQVIAGLYRDYTTPAANTVNNFALSCD